MQGYITVVANQGQIIAQGQALFKSKEDSISKASSQKISFKKILIADRHREPISGPKYAIGLEDEEFNFLDFAWTKKQAKKKLKELEIQVRLADLVYVDMPCPCADHPGEGALEVRVTDTVVWPNKIPQTL